MSSMLLRTLRDAPADAEVPSHRLLVRAGYVRRLSSGVYSYLPLGLRVLARVCEIVRDEMNRAGAQELLLPALQPVALWKESGRETMLDDALPAFRVEGRGGAYVLGPTAEEVVTATVGAEVSSYRDLPLTVYQIQTKFRDEARPRFGLLRTREFLMKDAYSFDASREAMKRSYQAMYDAYCAIFTRCGLPFTPVEADAGAMGGDVNHEFMVESPIGEDSFARCSSCAYAANIEAAHSGWHAEPARALEPDGTEAPALVEHFTPGCPGIDDVVAWFGSHRDTAPRDVAASSMLKCLAARDAEGSVVVVVVPGDREVRLPPGWNALGDDDFSSAPHLVKGYIGPMGLADHGVRVVADPLVGRAGAWVTGANKVDHHVSGAVPGLHFRVDEWRPVATVAGGDPCPLCRSPLEVVRSVEAGHTFQLGLAYSSKIAGATVTDEGGAEVPMWMGCFGIGVSRLVAVIAEANHDDAGIVWPSEVAPFDVHIVAVGGDRDPDVPATCEVAERDLQAAGIAVLHDDRALSPGVKFADADLIGIPVQIVVGTKGLARGVVEVKVRTTGERREVPRGGDLIREIADILARAR